MDKFPLAKPGWPYVAGFVALTAVSWALGLGWFTGFLILLTGFIVSFFRDPARGHQAGPDEVVSPADGRVVVIEEVEHPWLPGGRGTMVSIFMNVFNVHVNRAPVGGLVRELAHHRGAFVPADRPTAWRTNERVELALEDEAGRVLVVSQVAGLVARHIHCELSAGDTVQKGARFGMIRFGSRLDVYFPPRSTVRVRKGDRVRAGITILGELA